jgi:hypothetical protein
MATNRSFKHKYIKEINALLGIDYSFSGTAIIQVRRLQSIHSYIEANRSDICEIFKLENNNSCSSNNPKTRTQNTLKFINSVYKSWCGSEIKPHEADAHKNAAISYKICNPFMICSEFPFVKKTGRDMMLTVFNEEVAPTLSTSTPPPTPSLLTYSANATSEPPREPTPEPTFELYAYEPVATQHATTFNPPPPPNPTLDIMDPTPQPERRIPHDWRASLRNKTVDVLPKTSNPLKPDGPIHQYFQAPPLPQPPRKKRPLK